MKKLIIMGIALFLAAFAAEAGDSLDIETDEVTSKHKTTGRTLYKFMNVNEMVYEFVDTYVNDELDEDLDYRMDAISFAEEDHAIQYRFHLYDKDLGLEETAYMLDVYALPTTGVRQVVLYHPSA